MKRMSTILLTIVMAAALLAGCQATPEEPVVISKDTEQLIERAAGNENNLTLTQMLDAPGRLELSATDESGRVTVNADAEIVIPEVEAIPTMRVRKRGFTQEEADKVLAFFIGDKEFNDRLAEEYDEKVEKLIKWKAELARETDPEKRASLEQSIKKFESAGITVSDDPEEVLPAAKTFQPGKVGTSSISQIEGYSSDETGNQYLQIISNPSWNIYRAFYTREQNGYATHDGSYWYTWLKDNTDKVGLDPETVGRMSLAIAPEDAQNTAEGAIAALGVQDLTLSSCEEVWGGPLLKGGVSDEQGHHAYQLIYVRSVGGVPITYADNRIADNAIAGEDEEIAAGTVAPGWPYETMQFIIDDTGILQFIWQSPYEITETVAGASALKSFEEIRSVLSKMILVKYAYPGEENATCTIDLSKAQLGLMRITEKNQSDTALLVPVWDFFGTVTMQLNGQKSADEDMLASRITINAIDGNIIDRNLGY